MASPPPYLLPLTLTTTPPTLLLVALRLYARTRLTSYPLGYDDLFLLLAAFLLAALAALAIVTTLLLNTTHSAALLRHCTTAHLLLAPPLSACVRCALCTFYLRLLPAPLHARLRAGAKALLASAAPYVVASTALVLARRTPAAIGAVLAVGLASDVCVAVLPLPAIWETRLPWRTKVAVGALLAGGAVAGVGTAWRLTWVDDGGGGVVGVWWVAAQVEAVVGIGGACAPGLRPLWRRRAEGRGGTAWRGGGRGMEEVGEVEGRGRRVSVFGVRFPPAAVLKGYSRRGSHCEV
ncbi:hypothetical protein EDC01DRAFT_775051 [Geopyxis carbonaria]|nr:hypothetical protein EDC01DRAFT_775051 [Geopyxis carbonaria]